MHVLQLRVQIGQLASSAAIAVRLLRLLDVGVELDEGVGACRRVDLVAKLAVELAGNVLQEGEGRFLAELSVAEGEKARLLLNEIAKTSKSRGLEINKDEEHLAYLNHDKYQVQSLKICQDYGTCDSADFLFLFFTILTLPGSIFASGFDFTCAKYSAVPA